MYGKYVFLICCSDMFRIARKTNKTHNQVNEIDMYDLPNVKPGKNHLK